MVTELQQQLELLGEQLVVIGEGVSDPKSGNDSMNEPRPTSSSARPEETRSSVAKSWKVRTGSAELRTMTAGLSRIRSVRPAAAANVIAGADAAMSAR